MKNGMVKGRISVGTHLGYVHEPIETARISAHIAEKFHCFFLLG